MFFLCVRVLIYVRVCVHVLPSSICVRARTRLCV